VFPAVSAQSARRLPGSTAAKRGANEVLPTLPATRRCRSLPRQWDIAVVCLLLALSAGCNQFAAPGKNAEGVRFFQQARYQEALQQFQEACSADPNNADAYYNLAATYHRLGRMSNRQPDLDQAERLYNQCLDHEPNHRDCYRGLAVLLGEQGRSEEAFRLLQGWVDRQPGSPEARIELARLFDEMGERSAAKEHLLEALAIEPENPRALAALGKIREDSGESAQAVAAYQRSLARDSRQPEVAARVAALRSAVQPTQSTTAPAGGSRLVNGQPPSTSLR
jgi:tetratricopeptide (TPR) repeat protein